MFGPKILNSYRNDNVQPPNKEDNLSIKDESIVLYWSQSVLYSEVLQSQTKILKNYV